MFTRLVLLLEQGLKAILWWWWLGAAALIVAAVWWWYTASTPVRGKPTGEAAEDDDLST